MPTDAAVRIGAAVAACCAALWAGLLALAEEAAVGEALHTLGAEPPDTRRPRATLHRALHVARLALLMLGAVAAAAAVQWWARPWWSGLTAFLTAAPLLFLLGDAVPRAIAQMSPELADATLPLARRTLPPFAPLLAVLTRIDRWLHALVPAAPFQPTMGEAQRDMLLGVFSIADTTVDEVMTPRLDVVAVDLDASTEDVLDMFRRSEHTRLPVYDGTSDNVIGVVYAKDLVPLAMRLAEEGERWQELVRPASFVPETKTLDSLLRDFQRGPSHLAIVVDEFGGTAGLITLEDVLEEIVGEIRDEHDVEGPPPIQQEGKGYWVDGRVTLDDLSEALGRSFTHPEVSTVGGLIYSALGRVPRAGEELTVDGFRVVVERVERRRVGRVYFERQ